VGLLVCLGRLALRDSGVEWSGGEWSGSGLTIIRQHFERT
jgi:hypothetical protein